jgi:hypothetical protein
MSRHFAAYFAIVSTLAFAPGGAVNAGQLNIPNIPPPHISAPTPHLSVPQPHISVPTLRLSNPKLTAPNLVNFSKGTRPGNNGALIPPKLLGIGTGLRPNAIGPSKGIKPGHEKREIRVLTQGSGTDSSSGSTSAMPVSNTGGAYLTGGTPSFRCRSEGGLSNCP